VTRATKGATAGQRYLDLQREAKRTDRLTDELIQLYSLECFLDRLVRSEFARNFVLKGGVLLAALDARRPTRDIDLSASALDNDVGAILNIIKKIAVIALDDGLVFDADGATAETIREDDNYSGVRGYPLEMVLAEKVVTAIARGTANTRWRDFVDIYTLVRRHNIDGQSLRQSLLRVAQFRDVTLTPLKIVLADYAGLAQQRWLAWLKKQRLESRVSTALSIVLDLVFDFADPVIAGEFTDAAWDSATKSWK
jgi:hypothetical protein